MELYLQFGHGMMDHSRHLLDRWEGGTVVLSPRDLTDEQLSRLSGEIRRIKDGHVLFDPQFYLPHADHERLCSHEYWPNDYDTNVFWQGPALNQLLTNLHALNRRLRCRDFILPGLLAAQVDDDWLETQRAILEEALSLGDTVPLLCTVALAADTARDQHQIATLLEAAEEWTPAGYYLVCEHPNGDYLVEDPNWLGNVLDLVAGLRLRGRRVVVGYANHQMLALASAKANAVCSGTWMNVRSFPPEKFNTAYEDEIKRRAKWWYCPQSLSEYKLPFLDIAQRQGVLQDMQPPNDVDGGYATVLFSDAQPSTVDFSEQAAFRHYLYALRAQVAAAEASTFDDTIARHEAILESAEDVLSTLSAAGVLGQKRDFGDIIDVNRAALSLLSSTRGPLLRHRWNTL